MARLVQTLRASDCKITALTIKNSKLTVNQLIELLSLLSDPKCNITDLDFSHTCDLGSSLKDGTFKQIIEAIKKSNGKLKKLDLRYNNLPAEARKEISELLPNKEINVDRPELDSSVPGAISEVKGGDCSIKGFKNLYEKGDVKNLRKIAIELAKSRSHHGLMMGPLIKSKATENLFELFEHIMQGHEIHVDTGYDPKSDSLNYIVNVERENKIEQFNLTYLLKYANLNHIEIPNEYHEHYIKNYVNKFCFIANSIFRSFPSDDYFNERDSENSFSSLTYAEKLAINIYTGNAYISMNALLRGKMIKDDQLVVPALVHCIMAISGLNKVRDTKIEGAFRVEKSTLFPKEILEQRKTKAKLEKTKSLTMESGFISTSVVPLDEKLTISEAGDIFTFFYNISGKHIAPLVQFPHYESEYLIPPTQISWEFCEEIDGKLYFIATSVSTLTDLQKDLSKKTRVYCPQVFSLNTLSGAEVKNNDTSLNEMKTEVVYKDGLYFELVQSGICRSSPLFELLAKAIHENDKTKVISLFRSYSLPAFENAKYCSPLAIAAQEGRTEIIQILINKQFSSTRGFNLDFANSATGFRTALSYAAENNHREIWELLINAGADCMVKDNFDKIPENYFHEKTKSDKNSSFLKTDDKSTNYFFSQKSTDEQLTSEMKKLYSALNNFIQNDVPSSNDYIFALNLLNKIDLIRKNGPDRYDRNAVFCWSTIGGNLKNILNEHKKIYEYIIIFIPPASPKNNNCNIS